MAGRGARNGNKHDRPGNKGNKGKGKQMTNVLATWQCIVCDNACDTDDEDNPSIECFNCKHWSHKKCSKLTDQEFDVIANRNDLQWVCRQCMDEEKEKKSKTDSKLDMILTLIPMIHSMNEKILNIENEMGGKKLEDKIEEVVDKKIAEAFGEGQEREKRKKNLIITNVKESSKANPTERKEDDLDSAKNLLQQITDISEDEILEPTRLGSVGGNRPRLLRVTLKTEERKKEILRMAPKSKINQGKTENRKKHFINADYTPKEREENYKLRMEKKQRTDRGEEDLIIRNGKIVKKKKFPPVREDGSASEAETE